MSHTLCRLADYNASYFSLSECKLNHVEVIYIVALLMGKGKHGLESKTLSDSLQCHHLIVCTVYLIVKLPI